MPKDCHKYSQIDFSLIKSIPNAISDQADAVRLYGASFSNTFSSVAVGPSHVITIADGVIAIWDKCSGKQIINGTTQTLFGVFTTTFSVVFLYYDEFSHRFFVVTPNNTNYQIAISKSSKPKDLVNDWYRYTYNTGVTHLNTHVGLNCKYLYVTSTTDAFLNNVLIFNKHSLLNGGPLEVANNLNLNTTTTLINFIPLLVRPPTECHESSSSHKAYFVEFTSSTSLTLYVLIGNTTVKSYVIPITSWNAPPVTVPQPGGLPNLNTNDFLMTFGILINDSIYVLQNISSLDGRAILRWYEIKVTCKTPKLKQQGNIDPGIGKNAFAGHLAVDDHENVAFSFAISGATQIPALAYTGRLHCDPKGTTRTPVQIAFVGTVGYANLFPIPQVWGTTGIAVDPCHDAFWIYGQYGVPTQTGQILADWSTFLGSFKLKKSCRTQNNSPGGQV